MRKAKNVGLCLLLEILSVIFLLLSALCQFHRVNTYVQKYGKATNTKASVVCECVCVNHLAEVAAPSQPFQLPSLPAPVKLHGCNSEIFLGSMLYPDRTSEGNEF